MSVLFIMIAGAIGVSIEEAIERLRERRRWAKIAPRRARRYTFN